jgi:hypothetical protein
MNFPSAENPPRFRGRHPPIVSSGVNAISVAAVDGATPVKPPLANAPIAARDNIRRAPGRSSRVRLTKARFLTWRFTPRM